MSRDRAFESRFVYTRTMIGGWVISVRIIARKNIIWKGTENIDILIRKVLDEIDEADKGLLCVCGFIMLV